MARSRPSNPVTSIRLSPELEHELARGHESSRSRNEAINRFAVEGMRMDRHPGIVFRNGPAGRRPGLCGGPDVWEVARLLGEVEPRGDRAIDATAELSGLRREQVLVVAGYYAAYRSEIDGWIEMVDTDAQRQQLEWLEREAILA